MNAVSGLDLESVIHAAEEGGRVVKKYFGEALHIEEKSTAADFRTKADTESEEIIIKILATKFPSFNIFSEETGLHDSKSEYTFIIDPMDGSNNFALGIPNFSISIALVKEEKVILGVVHLPILNHTYAAQEARGTFLNKKRLHVNKESNIKNATVSYTCGYTNSFEYMEGLRKGLKKGLGIKRILDYWSPAAEFCLLASGKIEAIINNKNEFYDFAAGKIIAREAGALITGFDGKLEKSDRGDTFLASNGTGIHQQLLGVL